MFCDILLSHTWKSLWLLTIISEESFVCRPRTITNCLIQQYLLVKLRPNSAIFGFIEGLMLHCLATGVATLQHLLQDVASSLKVVMIVAQGNMVVFVGRCQL